MNDAEHQQLIDRFEERHRVADRIESELWAGESLENLKTRLLAFWQYADADREPADQALAKLEAAVQSAAWALTREVRQE